MAPRRVLDASRPARGEDTIRVGDIELPIGPHGCRWGVQFILENTPMHVVTVYRDQLDQLREIDYIWQPYSEEMIASLPKYCRDGMEIWRTRSPLICFEVVEWHFPERVLRQFGIRQQVPDMCDTESTLHRIDRRGHSGKNWLHEHKSYIQMWEERRGRIVDGDVSDKHMRYDDPYMVWYRSITRLLIGNPVHRIEDGYQGAGGVAELLTRSVTDIYWLLNNTLLNQHGVGELSVAVDSIHQTCYSTLLAIQERDRLASTHKEDISDPPPTATGPSSSVEPLSFVVLPTPDGPSPSVGPSSSVSPPTSIGPSPTIKPSANQSMLVVNDTISHSEGREYITPLPTVTPSFSNPSVSSPLPSIGPSIATTTTTITQYNPPQQSMTTHMSELLEHPVQGRKRSGVKRRRRARGKAGGRGRDQVHHPKVELPPTTT
ncbi:hypothetical protein L1049_025410 [Liquidambar formosana]|uniref:Aminotransferase-like plant mobile domain-containing protein n=1 Tax=Liquidambar formosana TaxID=63359 RepID=A0AAP0NAV9_LIQFO